MKALLPVCLAAAALLVACAPKQNSSEIDHVRAQLQNVLPDLKADAIRASDVPGLYEVQDGANFGYVTADGKYMIEGDLRSEEHTSELQTLMRISYAVFCLKQKKTTQKTTNTK